MTLPVARIPEAISMSHPNLSTITWLHLSDRHTCNPRTGVDASEPIEKLYQTLKRLQKDHQLRPDFLFFTGDLAWGKVPKTSLKDQFREGAQFLDRVRTCFSPPIKKQNVFLVPGNHDVNRDRITKSLTSHTENPDVIRNANWANEMMSADRAQTAQFMERFADYRQFLKSNGYQHLAKDHRLHYAFNRVVAGYKIGIVGFNSSWSCGRDNERGKLWSAGKWQADYLRTAVTDSDIRIALIHHPPSWFAEAEGNGFWYDCIERNYLFALHGHEHDAWVRCLNYGRHVTVSAGACYDHSESTGNGFSMVRIYPAENRGEVWLRKYLRGTGWIPEVIDGYTNTDGVWDLPYLHIDRDRQFMQSLATHCLKQLDSTTQRRIIGKKFAPGVARK